MTTTPTSQSPAQSPGRYWLDVALNTQDPHSMTGAAVTGLLAVLVDHEEAGGKAEASTAAYDELEVEVRQVEELASRRQQVIDDILAAVKPSTSKLADKVRAIAEEAFQAATDPGPPAEPAPDAPPADDAPVDEWRAYARSRTDVEVTGVDTANRSQIRTMLGLSHGSAE